MCKTGFTGRYRNLSCKHIKNCGKDSKWPKLKCSMTTVRLNEYSRNWEKLLEMLRKAVSASDCIVMIRNCFELLTFGLFMPGWAPGPGDGVIFL